MRSSWKCSRSGLHPNQAQAGQLLNREHCVLIELHLLLWELTATVEFSVSAIIARSNWSSSLFKSVGQVEINASWTSNLFMDMWINKLQPMGALASAGQMGQHSPDGMIGLAHSLMSSQIISSHRTDPLSHTQMRHGSGFHTSLSLYCCPSWMQPPASSAAASRGRGAGGQGKWAQWEDREEVGFIWEQAGKMHRRFVQGCSLVINKRWQNNERCLKEESG